MAKKKGPHYYLLARSYPETPFLSVWIMRRDGPASAGLLYGELLPAALSAVAEATGLPVEREGAPTAASPRTPRGCADEAAQRTLFTE